MIEKKEAEIRESRSLIIVCFFLVASLTYSSILKMEALHSPETLLNFYWTKRDRNPSTDELLAGFVSNPIWKMNNGLSSIITASLHQ
jgi:hypothetical protein